MSDWLTNLGDHDEPDGTSPYDVRNIYHVVPGDDWLDYARGSTEPYQGGRVFQIGAVRIPEDDSTRGKTPDEVRKMLKLAYPEIAHAQIQQETKDGVTTVAFKPVAGRKG